MPSNFQFDSSVMAIVEGLGEVLGEAALKLVALCFFWDEAPPEGREEARLVWAEEEPTLAPLAFSIMELAPEKRLNFGIFLLKKTEDAIHEAAQSNPEVERFLVEILARASD